MEDSMSWLLGNTLFSTRTRCLQSLSLSVFSQQLLIPTCTTTTRTSRQRGTCRSQCTTSLTVSPGTASFWWAVVGNIRSGLTGQSRESPSRRWDVEGMTRHSASCSLGVLVGCVLVLIFSAERGVDDVGVAGCVDVVLLLNDSLTWCGGGALERSWVGETVVATACRAWTAPVLSGHCCMFCGDCCLCSLTFGVLWEVVVLFL